MTQLLADLTLPLQPAAVTLRRVLSGVAHAHAQALQQAAHRQDRALAQLLAELADTGALRPLLLRPTVSVLARVWLAVPGQRSVLGNRLRAALAVEAALAGRLSQPVTVPALPLGLPRLGLRLQSDALEWLRIAPDGLELQGTSGREALAFADLTPTPPFWQAYLPVHPRLPLTQLALADDNPLPIFHDHPKRRGNVVGLGDAPVDTWLAQLVFAVDQLATHLPALLDEMRVFLGHIVPVGTLAEDHQSASYPHALGTIYLTLHPRPMMMLEALIHEFQHNKLHALLQLGPLLAGDEDLRVASPLRSDPRPLRGVLLAAHAFLPVAELYRRLVAADDPMTREHWFAERFQEIRRMNRQAWQTVQTHARWTPLAAGLADELARLDGELWAP